VGKSNPKDKSFDISKRLVWEAYKSVKANKGAAGVDGQSVEAFEADLRNNLYKIWNRMSSGPTFRLRCGRLRFRSRMVVGREC
jgi:retron-type reverse transcriptase